MDTEALGFELYVELTKTFVFRHQNSVPVLYQSTPNCIKKFQNHPHSPFLYNL